VTEAASTLRDLFARVYLPVDGSAHSGRAASLAVALASFSRGAVIAAHAYGARLHDRRFRQMEGGLPERYHSEEVLQHQRDVHDDLITRGLRLISDSYLDGVEVLAAPQGVPVERRNIEGRNWRVLLDDVVELQPDLVLIGALGLGATEQSSLGSVCSRLVRRLSLCDALVVRRLVGAPWDHMLVAIDGSEESFGALDTAVALAAATGGRVDLVSSFDPQFHQVAFGAIAGVLSAEAAEVFRFEQQQQLHGEIIDDGLARIYQGHLDDAVRFAAQRGVQVGDAALLPGKAPDCLERHVRELRPSLVLLGRTGVHSDGGLDLGSCTERVLTRDLGCDVWLSARRVCPPILDEAADDLPWTEEATALLERVPGFVRPMVRRAITRATREADETIVTVDRVRLVQGRAGMGGSHGGPASAGEDHPPDPPASGRPDGPPDPVGLPWDADAEAALDRIPGGFMLDQARQAIELRADALGKQRVDIEAVDAQYGAWDEGAAKAVRELVWDEAALARLQRIPPFIRGGVLGEVERRAWEQGLDRVTLAFYEQAVAGWTGGGDFHS
jgi:nucleotide-binding universal stress UspA family protein